MIRARQKVDETFRAEQVSRLPTYNPVGFAVIVSARERLEGDE